MRRTVAFFAAELDRHDGYGSDERTAVFVGPKLYDPAMPDGNTGLAIAPAGPNTPDVEV